MRASNFSISSNLSTGFLASILVLTPTLCIGANGPDLQLVSGYNQQTSYASAFVKPLTVWVEDSATKRSLPGMRVKFTAGAGLRLSSSFATTDDLGLASVSATGLAVGNSTVRAEIDGFSGAFVDFTGLVVEKAVLTVIPADVQSVVGQIPDMTEYRIEGFANGETEDSAQVSGAPLLTTIATESSPDANYAIKGQVGTMTSPNYDFKPGFGALILRGGSRASQTAVKSLVPSPDSPVVQSAFQSLQSVSPVNTLHFVVRKATFTQIPEPEASSVGQAATVQQAVLVPRLPIEPAEKRAGVVQRTVVDEISSASAMKTSTDVTAVQGIRNAPPLSVTDVSAATPASHSQKIKKAFNPPMPK